MEADFHALGKAISASFDLSLTIAQRIVLLGRWPVWMQMLRRLIESRRRRPRDGDFLSYLISVRDQDQALSEDELIALVLQFITAGADTTAHATCRVIYNLLRHPAQFSLLQADPSLLRNAIEEILRFDSIIKFSPPRFARHDLEVAGVAVRKGQALYPLLPSALHDPVVFAAPEQLDIRRDPTGSIVYSCGPHNCMGASLARLELEVFIGTTLRRFPQLELAGEPELEVHSILRPMSQLPVRLASA
jgi:cytochrome P450